MGLLDNLRDRLRGDVDDYDDDYYDDYDDEYDDDYDDEPSGSGLLGNTPRPEAESVAVYTRSGRPVSSGNNGQQGDSLPVRGRTEPSDSSYSSYRSRRQRTDDYDEGYGDLGGERRYTPSRTATFAGSGQLPPYVLRAEAYEDVQSVVRRVRTNQTVLLDLSDTPSDVAQRILDFCFGLSFGIDGEVSPMGSSAFAILPSGMHLSAEEAERLLAQER